MVPAVPEPHIVQILSGAAVVEERLAALLDRLRGEVSARYAASTLFVQGIAQSLAVHLARNYTTGAGRQPRDQGRITWDYVSQNYGPDGSGGTSAQKSDRMSKSPRDDSYFLR